MLLAVGAIGLVGSFSSCGKSKQDDASKQDSLAVEEKKESDPVSSYDCGIDFSKIVAEVINGDTTQVNEYDAEGRLVKHGYMRDGEEGGDSYWCQEITVFNERGDIKRTESHQGEWEVIDDYIYDNQHRLVEIRSNVSSRHFTWDGLTSTDDGFCVEKKTYSDNTYKHVVNVKSYTSGNGPIAHETDYDLEGREISHKSYTDGVLSYGWDTEYKDNKSIRYNVKYNPDGSVKSREADWVYEFIPDGKYCRVISSHSFDGSSVGYTVDYDEKGFEIATHGEYANSTTTWNGNTATKKEDGTTYVTTYLKTK